MGILDTSPLDLVEKFRSWSSWREVIGPQEKEMPGNSCKFCCECDIKSSGLDITTKAEVGCCVGNVCGALNLILLHPMEKILIPASFVLRLV